MFAAEAVVAGLALFCALAVQKKAAQISRQIFDKSLIRFWAEHAMARRF